LSSKSGEKSLPITTHELFLKAKKSQDVLIMGGTGQDGRGVDDVTKIIISQDGTIRFEKSMPMLAKRENHVSLYHQGEVFSISSGSAERIDTLTKKRTFIETRLPTIAYCLSSFPNSEKQYNSGMEGDLYRAAAAIFGNKLLVLGGGDRYDVESKNDVYALREHTTKASKGFWSVREAKLNTARSSAAAVSFQGRLFLCGGYDINKVHLRTVEVLDPAVGIWRVDEQQMVKARSFFSLFDFQDELYAVGGDVGGSTTIEKRNKATKRWELITDCGQNRRGCAAVLLGSKVFLFGGFEHMSTFDFVDLHSKKWASQDVTSACFDKAKRKLPRQVYCSTAVLIAPEGGKVKTWTDLILVKPKERDMIRRIEIARYDDYDSDDSCDYEYDIDDFCYDSEGEEL